MSLEEIRRRWARFPEHDQDVYDQYRRDVELLLRIAEEASETVDIGDEANRCRLCWECWGDHRADCPIGELARAEPRERRERKVAGLDMTMIRRNEKGEA